MCECERKKRAKIRVRPQGTSVCGLTLLVYGPTSVCGLKLLLVYEVLSITSVCGLKLLVYEPLNRHRMPEYEALRP